MASDGNTVRIPAVSPVHGSQATIPVSIQERSGKILPQDGKNAVAPAARPPAPEAAQALVAQLNKHLNDSGRPDQFRVDPGSDKVIQQINPANGEVVGEFLISEFPALARSVGVTGGGLVDSRA